MQWVKRIQHCCSCGIGHSCAADSVSGPGTSISCGCGHLKKYEQINLSIYVYRVWVCVCILVLFIWRTLPVLLQVSDLYLKAPPTSSCPLVSLSFELLAPSLSCPLSPLDRLLCGEANHTVLWLHFHFPDYVLLFILENLDMINKSLKIL